MNQVWGSMHQYSELPWEWPIAVYLILAGLSAGATVMSILVKWMQDKESTQWDGFVKAGALIGPSVIVVGLLLLIVDLSKPLWFWALLIHYQLSSVMALGVIFLLIYTPCAFAYAFAVFKEDALKLCEKGLLSAAKPLVCAAGNFLEGYRPISRTLEIVLIAMALGVGVYTGFLLSALKAMPLMNTPLLPLLFMVSALSAGAAGNMLLGLGVFGQSAGEKQLRYLHAADFRLVPVEGFMLFLIFIGMLFQGSQAALVASAALTHPLWGMVFWVGVVGIGLLAPVVLAIRSALTHSHSHGTIMLSAAMVLVGVVALRFFFVMGGQALTANPLLHPASSPLAF